MTKQEYIKAVKSTNIDMKTVSKLERVYNHTLPTIIAGIVSYSSEAVFFDDDTRILSVAEMLDAEKDLHVDFVNQGMMPIADCNENNFIVFHFETGKWSKYNIEDGIVFKEREHFEELL